MIALAFVVGLLALTALTYVASGVLRVVVWVSDRRVQRARAANEAARAAMEADRETFIQEMMALGQTRIEVEALIVVASAQVAIWDGAKA